MPTPTLILRQATDHDISHVNLFYSQNAHPSLAVRSSDVLEETVQQGRCFVIERERDGALLAASLVLLHTSGACREAAGTRITSAVGGLGLHQILYRVRSVHEHLIGSCDSFFTAVNARNERSISNAIAVGFQDWQDAPLRICHEASARCGIGTRVLEMPAQALFIHASCVPLTISWTRLLPYSTRPVGRIVRRSSRLSQLCASFVEGHFTRSPQSSTSDLVMRPPA